MPWNLKLAAVYVFSLLIVTFAIAQTQTKPQTQTQPEPPPSTDIYIADLMIKDGKLMVTKPMNLTNRPGYDNQPSFFPDNQLYYTSIRNGQADIYAIDLKTKETKQVTNTPESEYSATLTPDGKHISVIRVEADQTQRLWKFPRNGGEPAIILENVKPVGYHVWSGSDSLVLFILGEPASLAYIKLGTGEATLTLAKNIGRCLQRVPNGGTSFVEKNDKNEWWIKEVKFDGHATHYNSIAKALSSEEHDYAWTPDGVILMAHESKLYSFKPGKDSDWQSITEFSQRGISRLAVSPDGKRLALVALE